MRYVLLCLLAIAASTSLGVESPGWVVSCRVVDDEVTAIREMDLLDSLGYQCGVLQMSDWVSLEGQEGWMTYVGPLASGEEASRTAAGLLWRFHDAHGTIVHQGESNCTVTAWPEEFTDLTGLFPPTQDFMLSVPLPASWDISLESCGPDSLDEWDRPVHIYGQLPGWRIDEWEDVYLGTIELRAVRLSDPMNAQIFERHCRYLREAAPDMGAVVMEEFGKFILLHVLPSDMDRNGDLDLWAVLSGDSIEYGYRCRSFFGEMPYSWNSVPLEARSSLLPVAFDSYSGALDLLIGRLLEDEVYTGGLEDISLGIERMDGWEEGVYRDYHDVALREVHREGGPGDPITAPIVDRFRVYDRTGEILWWHPLHGEFIPYWVLLTSWDD